MPPAEFEPAIPASQRPQPHALDRKATGIGNNNNTHYQYVAASVPESNIYTPLSKRNILTDKTITHNRQDR